MKRFLAIAGLVVCGLALGIAAGCLGVLMVRSTAKVPAKDCSLDTIVTIPVGHLSQILRERNGLAKGVSLGSTVFFVGVIITDNSHKRLPYWEVGHSARSNAALCVVRLRDSRPEDRPLMGRPVAVIGKIVVEPDGHWAVQESKWTALEKDPYVQWDKALLK